MIEDFSRAHAVRGSSNRSFGLVFAAFFTIAGFWPLRVHKPIRAWAVGFAALFLIAALAKPGWLAPLNRVWTEVGRMLARITTPIVTGLLFFLVATPIAIVMRMAGKDGLRLARNPTADTYWIPRDPPGPASGTMTNQF